MHSMSQPNIHHTTAPPPPPQHSLSQSNIHPYMAQAQSQPSFVRPIARVPVPAFMGIENFQMTDRLMAEIDHAHYVSASGTAYGAPPNTHQPPDLSGTSGVAYAGGASSNSIPKAHFESGSPPKDPVMERLRAAEWNGTKEQEGGQRGGVMAGRRDVRDKDRDNREREREREREISIQRRGSVKRELPPQPQPLQNQAPLRDESPQFHPPMGSPEHALSHVQYEYAPHSPPRAPTPPAIRKLGPPYTDSRQTPPTANANATVPLGTSKVPNQTPPGQATKARTPDKSLPVQEEPEEDVPAEAPDASRDRWAQSGTGKDYVHQEPDEHEYHRHSPAPSSDLHPDGNGQRYDPRREVDGRQSRAGREDTHSHSHSRLEQDLHMEDDRGRENGGDQEDDGYTPRSPVTSLPMDRNFPAARAASPSRHQLPRIRARNGSTDQLGLRTFDAAVFENTIDKLRITDPGSPPPHTLHQRAHSQSYYDPRHPGDMPLSSLRHAQHADESEHFLDDPAASYYQNYQHYPYSPASSRGPSAHQHVRPGAPIPPTPHSQTAAPSPSPLISGMQSPHNRSKPVLPPYSPAPPPGGSPYPYPYGHIRRGYAQQSLEGPGYAGSHAGTGTGFDMANYDPAVIREQIALQMQIYALNNGGMASDATSLSLSPSSTPFPGPNYNPWPFLQSTRVFGPHGRMRSAEAEAEIASMRSSPSHEPLPLPDSAPVLRHRGLKRRERSVNLRVQGAGGVAGKVRQKIRPPPRVESTQPRETSPELSSGEETAGEAKTTTTMGTADDRDADEGAQWATEEGSEDTGEWVDEDEMEEEGEGDDLLQLEYHTDYVTNPDKRRRRWKSHWGTLVRAFQALDRETDTTLVLLAAPSHSSKLHSVTSRALRRDSSLARSAEMSNLRGAFSQLASRRTAARVRSQSQVTSLVERLSLASSSRDGSPASNESKEEDLRRALDAALGSLSALGGIYEQREVRWVEEMRRLDEDRLRVQLLLSQVLGVGPTEGPYGHSGNGVV